MKTKFKGLLALWLTLALAMTMVLPISAADFEIRVYTGDTPISAGDGIEDNRAEILYSEGTALNAIDVSGTDVDDLSNIAGWKVWNTNDYGEVIDCETELAPDAVISGDEYDFEYYYWYTIFEPIRTGSLRRITKQPYSHDVSVEVNYADKVAYYQWYLISNSDEIALDGETASRLSNVVIGEEYFCEIVYEDEYTLTSRTVVATEQIIEEPNGFNAIIALLLRLKYTMRYYDGDEYVGSQRIELNTNVDPLTLDERDGMVLEGWYIDEELTVKFDFSNPVEHGRKLFAKWVQKTEFEQNEPVDSTEE